MIIGEKGRQLIHAVAGLLFMAIAFYQGRDYLIALTFGLLIFGSILINMRLTGSKFFVISWIEHTFERRESRFPGWGPSWYLAGVLLIAVFLQDITKIMASIYVLAVGDGISTLVGIALGKNKLPFAGKKSVEGTLGFMLACLPLYVLIGWKVLPLAIVAGLVEAYSGNLEDNLTIPMACVIMFSLFL